MLPFRIGLAGGVFFVAKDIVFLVVRDIISDVYVLLFCDGMHEY